MAAVTYVVRPVRGAGETPESVACTDNPWLIHGRMGREQQHRSAGRKFRYCGGDVLVRDTERTQRGCGWCSMRCDGEVERGGEKKSARCDQGISLGRPRSGEDRRCNRDHLKKKAVRGHQIRTYGAEPGAVRGGPAHGAGAAARPAALRLTFNDRLGGAASTVALLSGECCGPPPWPAFERGTTFMPTFSASS